MKFQVNNFSDIWKKRVSDIDQGNIRKYHFIYLMPCLLGDIQVMIQAPANKKNKGFEYALIAEPSIT